MTGTPARFPKLESPYVRTENSNGDYTVSPTVGEEFSWVFDRAEDVIAVEKIDGTNVAVYVDNGEITDVATRLGDRSMNSVQPYMNANQYPVVRGVQNSVRRGYADQCDTGWNFGELVGPKINGNSHELDEHLFIPFEWLRDNCSYNSFGEYPTGFEHISGWFEDGLFSLFYMKMHGTGIDEASVTNGTFVEGIVFVHPDLDGSVRPSDLEMHDHPEYGMVTHDVCKLRRDMFSWYY